VCEQDPFCCQQAWDGLCVQEVTSICGESCGQCQPNGAPCVTGQQCCSGSCQNGLCTDSCSPDGSPCMSDAQCCTGECNAGVCGAPLCPSDGSECGDCVAQSCCNQLLSCFNSPSCVQDVQCFFQCVGGGGGPAQCFFQCVDSPQAIGVLVCVGSNCGPGTCF
jgi:hypothetical protein